MNYKIGPSVAVNCFFRNSGIINFLSQTMLSRAKQLINLLNIIFGMITANTPTEGCEEKLAQRIKH